MNFCFVCMRLCVCVCVCMRAHVPVCGGELWKKRWMALCECDVGIFKDMTGN